MKRIGIYAALIILASLTMVSCDKDQEIFSSEEMENLKSGRHNGIHARTIFLSPEGPDCDTDNLMAAIKQAQEMGPGAIIFLRQGVYYFDRIELYNFRGTIRGEGIGKTIIKPHPDGINMPVYEPPLDVQPFFFNFYGGDFTVDNLEFLIDKEDPVKTYEYSNGDIVNVMGAVIWISGLDEENNTANSRFSNLCLKGKMIYVTDRFPSNMDNGIYFGFSHNGFPIEGRHIIQNCHIESAETAVIAFGAINSNFTFGGSPSHGNTISEVYNGFFLLNNNNSSFMISHNKIQKVLKYAGIGVLQLSEAVYSPFVHAGQCNFNFQNNEIQVEENEYADGFNLSDFAGTVNDQERSKFTILKNHITLTGYAQAALNPYYAYNGNFTQNTICGQSYWGIVMEGGTSDWKIINNNFDNFTTDWVDIALGPNTHDNKLVNNGDISVYDGGQNNTILGPHVKSNEINPKFTEHKIARSYKDQGPLGFDMP